MKSLLSLTTLGLSFLTIGCSLESSLPPESITEDRTLALEESCAVDNPYYWTSQIADRALPISSMLSDDSSGSNRASSIGSEGYYPDGPNFLYSIFEDNFPNKGDYDFNDLVVRSKYLFYNEESESTIPPSDGWKIRLTTILVNDGASYDFELGYMFYNVTGSSDTGYDYQRIPNDNITMGFPVPGPNEQDDPEYSAISGSEPWSEDVKTLFGLSSTAGFNSYTGSDYRTICFEITGLSDMSGTGDIAKIWISTFIKVKNTGKTILATGFPDISYTDKFKLLDGHPNYMVPADDPIMPTALEFVALSFTPTDENQLISDKYPNFNSSDEVANWFE